MLCTIDQITVPFYLQVEAIQVQSLLGMLDPEYKVTAFLLSVRNSLPVTQHSIPKV